MSETIKPRLLKGFRDFLPEEETRRKEIQRRVEEVFTRFGFLPIDTPVLEYTEVLLGKGGGETDKQVYRFEDHGGRDVSMRFDLTVPFARYMAQHKEELYLPFRRYHIGKVFRGENTQRGRYREFTQCDFDIVGPDSVSADFDILLVMVRSLEALGITAFHVSLAHRGVFNTFLDTLELQEQSVEILRTVDKLRKLGPEKTRETLAELTDSASADRILDYITPAGDTQATLAKLESLVGSEAEPLRRLKQLLRSAEEAGIGHRVQLDPSITRGLDYYTGTVFETFLDGQEHIGSVCSGGRYNDLASLYTKQELPGVGSSIGLDRLIAALDEQRSEEAQRGSVSVLILCVDEELVGYYHTLAEAFRKAGFSAEVYPEKKKLATQFGFAEKKGIPLGVIAGGDERARNVINLRDLRRRENYEDLSLEDAVARAGELL